MARRTKKDSLLTRDAILDAAEHVFRDKGVARTRMEDIAHGADCTRGAIYWHFKNKTDVLLAMLDRITLPLYDSINQMLSSASGDPLGQWRTHLLDSMRKIETDPQQQNICDILINRCELNGELAELREMEQQRSEFFITSTQRLLEMARDDGQVRNDIDLGVAALGIHAMVHGFMRLWLRQSGNFPLRDSVAASLDLFVDAITPQHTTSSASCVRMAANG